MEAANNPNKSGESSLLRCSAAAEPITALLLYILGFRQPMATRVTGLGSFAALSCVRFGRRCRCGWRRERGRECERDGHFEASARGEQRQRRPSGGEQERKELPCSL